MRMEVGQTEDTSQRERASQYPDAAWTEKRAAHWYGERGFKVFPVGADKLPLIKEWPKTASSDPAQIDRWWSKFPNANIGVLCGPASNLAVIDIDVKGGAKGAESAAALEDEHGPYASGLMVRTPSGGSHHWYAYSEAPFNSNAGRAAEAIDLRSGNADGSGSGYVLVPPSIIDGKRYVWERFDTDGPSTIPNGLALVQCFSKVELAVIANTPGLREKILARPRAAWRDLYNIERTFSTGELKRLAQGAEPCADLTLDTPYIAQSIERELENIANARKDQNDNLSRCSVRLGALLGGMGRSADSADAKWVKQEIVKAALSMKVLYPSKPWDDEAGRRAIEATGIRQFEWGLKHPRDLSDVNTKCRRDTNDDAASEETSAGDDADDAQVELPPDITKKNTREIKFVSMAEIRAKPIEWLFKGTIPRGMQSSIVGDPGHGKSQITCDMAAAVTTGKPWDDGDAPRKPASVAMLNAEDPYNSVVVPRLMAAGADLSKVYAAESTIAYGDDGKATEGELSLARDIKALSRMVREIGDVALIVIDPISAYLGKTDSNNNSEVRGVLAPLARLAEKYNLAVVCVTHLNKGSGDKVVNRAVGSIAFTAAARAVYIVGPDPDAEEGDKTKLFQAGKSNIAPPSQARSYNVEQVQVIADGVPMMAPRVVWGARKDMTPERMLRGKEGSDGRREGREKLASWLSTFLADGHWHPFEKIDEAAKRAGHDRSRSTFQRVMKEIGAEHRRPETVGESGSEWKLPRRN